MNRKFTVLMALLLILSPFVIAIENVTEEPLVGEAGKIVKGEGIEYTVPTGFKIEETGRGGPSGEGQFGPITVIDGEPNFLEKIWLTILNIGSLKWLLGGAADNQFCGFLRIALAIIIFTLLYLGLSLIPNFSKGMAITIGIILSIISVIFMPCSVLLAFGSTYAVLFSFIIIGGPIVGGMLLVFLTPTPNRVVAAIKGFCLVILGVFINVIAYWAVQVYQATP